MNDEDFAYHWTHRDTLRGIIETGLDPAMAEGKLKVVWFCDSSKVGYALGHIAYRHGWPADDMVLIRFPRDPVPYANTAWGGIFTTTERVKIKAHCAVKFGVLGEWVSAATVRKDIDRYAPTDRGTDTRC